MPKKATNVFKRKDGRWEARYVKSFSENGKKIYGSVYGRSFEEAKNKQEYYLRNMNNVNLSKKTFLLRNLMYEWLISITNSVKKSTYQKYEGVVRNHIQNHPIANIRVDFIDTRIINHFSDNLLSSEKLSAKTVNDILIVLGLILKYTEEVYNIPKSKIKYVRVNNKEMRVLSLSEQEKLENYLNKNMNYYKLGIIIALYTGIRVGELCALRWDDIHNGNIYINKTVQRVKEVNKTIVSVSEPKTKSSIRVIPTPVFLQSLLEKYRSTGTVVKNRKGKAVEPRLMQATFKKYIVDCGLPKTNFHALRHTFATRCVEAGFDIKSLSEILGHSDVKTTLNKYVHSSLEQKQKNMKLIKPIINL